MLNQQTLNIYDADGNVVSTETITGDDLVGTQMGAFMNYSCEKEISLDEGTYQISLTAIGDGKYAEASDESEKLDLVVAAGTTSEGYTSGYTVEDAGSMGMDAAPAEWENAGEYFIWGIFVSY